MGDDKTTTNKGIRMNVNRTIFIVTTIIALVLGVMVALFVDSCCTANRKLVQVRIVTVWDQKDYEMSKCGPVPFAHTVVERLDTHERIRIQKATWGKTGDVFTVRSGNLHW